jgi:uncharacterized protein YggE
MLMRTLYSQFCLLGALFLLPVLAVPVSAQVMRPAPAVTVSNTGLTVYGHAELKFKPDIATLTVGVTTQSTQQTDAAQQNATKTTAVLSALRGVGIADKDIQTSGYDIQPQYDYKPSPPLLTGYQVSNTVTVTIRDLSKAGNVIDAATKAGATNISDLSFDLADRTAAEQKALAQAVREAQAKAAAMAQAAGVNLGPLTSLSEGTPAAVQPFVMSRSLMAAKTPDVPTTPIQFNQITVTADVTAIYNFSR